MIGFLDSGIAGWIGLGVVLVSIFVIRSVWESKTYTAWEKAVPKLGLEFDPVGQTQFADFPPASGSYLGKSLTMSIRLRLEEKRSSTKGGLIRVRKYTVRKYHTVVETELANGWPLQIPRIESRPLGARILALFGLGIGDYGIGDKSFDLRYQLTEKPSSDVLVLLNRPDIKFALIKLSSLSGAVRIDEGSIRIERRGRMASVKRLVNRVDEIIRQVKVIDNAVGRRSGVTSAARPTIE